MPIGYWWTVAITSWGVACALTRWPRLGALSEIPAVIVNELPFIVGYLLVASTVLALVGGEPGTLLVTGSSAGANLAIRAVSEGETGIAGLTTSLSGDP
jgi:hypothetical protein